LDFTGRNRPTRAIVHNLPFTALQQLRASKKFGVENLDKTPYRTRSYLPASLGKPGWPQGSLSPRIPSADGREETLLF
jgi:hypothetical protein